MQVALLAEPKTGVERVYINNVVAMKHCYVIAQALSVTHA